MSRALVANETSGASGSAPRRVSGVIAHAPRLREPTPARRGLPRSSTRATAIDSGMRAGARAYLVIPWTELRTDPMNRLLIATTVVALLTSLSPQDPHLGMTLPPVPVPARGTGEVIEAFIVGAEMIEDGQVRFSVAQHPQDTRTPPPPPSFTAKVDGKLVRALDVDGKPLAAAELKNRLPTWTAVVVIPADLDMPDPFFRKVLSERTVTFMLPKKLLLPMTKAAWTRRKTEAPRP